MYNLVWQSVMCRPGKRLILLVRKNQMLRPTAPTARPRQPLGENASPGIGLTSGNVGPPSDDPGRHSHRDCRSPLTLIIARQKPEPELSPILEHLIAAGLLFRQGVPPHASYLFKHALVRDAASRDGRFMHG
jgi:hypothetical protein